jgi:uncharacterized protein (DUF433 family)
MNYTAYLELNPVKRLGKPIIIGTRISVFDVLSWLAEGMTTSDIIPDFPELSVTQRHIFITPQIKSAG